MADHESIRKLAEALVEELSESGDDPSRGAARAAIENDGLQEGLVILFPGRGPREASGPVASMKVAGRISIIGAWRLRAAT